MYKQNSRVIRTAVLLIHSHMKLISGMLLRQDFPLLCCCNICVYLCR